MDADIRLTKGFYSQLLMIWRVKHLVHLESRLTDRTDRPKTPSDGS